MMCRYQIADDVQRVPASCEPSGLFGRQLEASDGRVVESVVGVLDR